MRRWRWRLGRKLQLIAGRVAAGDYALEHTGRQQGVYASLVLMVEALKAHIESARCESAKAQEESARANAALQQALRNPHDRIDRNADQCGIHLIQLADMGHGGGFQPGSVSTFGTPYDPC